MGRLISIGMALEMHREREGEGEKQGRRTDLGLASIQAAARQASWSRLEPTNESVLRQPSAVVVWLYQAKAGRERGRENESTANESCTESWRAQQQRLPPTLVSRRIKSQKLACLRLHCILPMRATVTLCTSCHPLSISPSFLSSYTALCSIIWRKTKQN